MPALDNIASRSFDISDQERFAGLSGDRNPMHLDPVAARRTMAGEPVVHGMHILLWALDVVAARDPAAAVPTALRADFATFLPLGPTISLALIEAAGKRRITVSNGGQTVMVAELRYAPARPTDPVGFDGPASPVPASPVTLGPDDLATIAGAITCAADTAAIGEAFPAAAAWLGADRIGALLSCTAVVGMICPGLHSIFNRVDVALQGSGPAGRLDYAVSSVDQRFGRVLIGVTSAGVSGTLHASLRPSPVEQPGMAALAASVIPGEFGGGRALVIGGSRGLGELAAKLLASGGAQVIVTYAQGREDAENVCADIVRSGGTARAIPLDVLGDVAAGLDSAASAITSCYYFATPRIFAKAASLYDKVRFDQFCAVYVDAFGRVCDYLSGCDAARLGVYYPSSVFVEERPPGMAEYAMAKAAGEILCDEYNRRQDKLHILSTRLPKLDTDQTATLTRQDATPAVEYLIDVLRQVESSAKHDVG